MAPWIISRRRRSRMDLTGWMNPPADSRPMATLTITAGDSPDRIAHAAEELALAGIGHIVLEAADGAPPVDLFRAIGAALGDTCAVWAGQSDWPAGAAFIRLAVVVGFCTDNHIVVVVAVYVSSR